jgi:hypothetical protein
MSNILKQIKERYPDTPFREWHGFEDAVLDVAERCGQEPYLVYDFVKMVAIYMNEQGCEEDVAIDEIYYNYINSWNGEHTPVAINQHYYE